MVTKRPQNGRQQGAQRAGFAARVVLRSRQGGPNRERSADVVGDAQHPFRTPLGSSEVGWQPTSEKAGRGFCELRPGPEGAQPTVDDLRSIERAARRLRSAEAQVADIRMALEQEIWRAIDTTSIPVSETVEVAGPSRLSTTVLDRWMSARLPEIRRAQPR